MMVAREDGVMVTREDVRAFIETVNRGRVACGLAPVEKIDYEDARPGAPDACLSAQTLAMPLGGRAGTFTFYGLGDHAQPLARALGMSAIEGTVKIPSEIRTVTDEFDALGSDVKGTADDEVYQALKAEGLVE